jgi:hypothetical protein
MQSDGSGGGASGRLAGLKEGADESVSLGADAAFANEGAASATDKSIERPNTEQTRILNTLP